MAQEEQIAARCGLLERLQQRIRRFPRQCFCRLDEDDFGSAALCRQRKQIDDLPNLIDADRLFVLQRI
jgi:hypothetical protein